ncbi:uncharacterized protein VICG_01726 [Vittaforma corneae ATCC 50505]|uniref:Uncharacterized protein n=1 Tax=Vittaforma corneae (strain ATCC 50505) TaxID=993615 RepID=L2GLS5_VITCO|nr:uncharacterized protein VICG_01726 [Vittaforma corneae ATCC 50505]ELA41237.1 hypothetical protein VICG_01726 [Vittaforma corneae ATCC 50505]
MSELVFEDVSMEINKVAIANNLTFYATRLCCIFFSPDCGTFKELSLLFSKIHLHSANEIKVRGSVYFDGKVLPAAKFHHLLNQHVVCEGNDSVFDVLSLINREEAENMVRKLDIYFYNKRTDHLNVQESRIFEIAVNLIAKPPVMYLKVLGMSRKQKDKCLSILSEFVQQHESVVFVETDFRIYLTVRLLSSMRRYSL